MLTYVVALALAFALATGLTPLVRAGAIRFGFFDAHNSRKVHQQPIPRLGGIAIVLGFYAPIVGLALYRNLVSELFYANEKQVLGFFAGGLTIAALGLFDDLKGARARHKFAVQGLVAVGMYLLGFQVHGVANPFGAPIELGYVALPFTVLWIVGVINAMNLIDGLDGLAGGVAFFAVLMNFLVSLSRGDVLMSLLMASLAGAILGFLLFNFNPASIFMGDTGSMFLGFILATGSLVTSTKSAAAVSMLVPMLALGLPLMDTTLAIMRRYTVGRPMFSADREHIHHRLLKLGYSHRRAVLAMYLICAFFAAAGLAITFANGRQAAAILAAVGAVVFLVVRRLGFANFSKTGEVLATRRKNLAVRATVAEIGEALREAAQPATIWECIQPIGEPLNLASLTLKLQTPGSEVAHHEFQMLRAQAGEAGLELVLHVEVEGERRGELRARWGPDRSEIGRDEELALELLVDHVRRAVTRTGGRKLRLVR